MASKEASSSRTGQTRHLYNSSHDSSGNDGIDKGVSGVLPVVGHDGDQRVVRLPDWGVPDQLCCWGELLRAWHSF
jgi:hypothetical protein